MAWSGTPAEKRAYAIKKRKERATQASKAGDDASSGFKIAPNQHRCGVGDILACELPGTPILGRRCQICGRTWRYAHGNAGWLTVSVVPTTPKCPPAGEHLARETFYVNVPTGRLGELPPDDLTGEGRGMWWRRFGELRLERRESARQARAAA